MTSFVSYFIRKEIEDKLKFALFNEDYLNLFKKISKHLSVMFICSSNDLVVPKEEVE